MALFGSINAGFGAQRNFLGQPVEQNRFAPIIGIGSGLLSAQLSSNLAFSALRGLPQDERDRLNFRDDEAATVPPWLRDDAASNQSLNAQIREIRAQETFIDTDFAAFREATGDPDAQATFVIFRALERLKAIADFSGQDGTPEASLERLDELFQQGLNEIRTYIGETPLNRLELFLGDKESRTETSTRLGRNSSSYEGGLVTNDATTGIEGITGTESFTVTLEKTDLDGNVTRTDDFVINLGGATSLNDISALINSTISSLQATDSGGAPLVDDNGDPIPEYQTRFDVEYDVDAKQYRLQLNGSILENINLTASDFTPSLYVASGVTPVGTDEIPTARLQEVSNIDGELSVATLQSFSGINLAETELAENTDVAEEESNLTAEQIALRDQFRSDAREDVLSESELEAFNENQSLEAQAGRAITDVDDEFRVNAATSATRVATDSGGNIFVVGTTEGTFGNQINVASGSDVFLTKFDSAGNVVFSRLLGATDTAEGFAVTVDDQDNVIVAGQTNNTLVDGDLIESEDAFVAKFNNQGTELFRYQLDTARETAGLAITTTASTLDINGNTVDGDIILGGFTRGGISAASGFSGSTDGLLLKIDGTTGTLTDSSVFGTAAAEEVRGIALASDGNILIATEESGSAYIKKVDATNLSTELYAQSLGPLGAAGQINGLSVDGTQIAVVGTTNGQAVNTAGGTQNGTASGGIDGFVVGLTDTGSGFSGDFTTIFDTGSTDRISDVSVSGGTVYVAGVTSGTFAGEQDRGALDGFVARVNGTTGAIENTEQFGQFLSNTDVGGVAFTDRGSSILDKLGLASGRINADQTLDIETQTSARVGDYFTLRVDDGRRPRSIKIELEAGDTFEDIARAIRTQAFNVAEVTVSGGSEGEKLKIEALRSRGSPELELIPGEDGQDLLSRIGLTAGRLLPSDEVLGLNREDLSRDEKLGGAFGLRLEGALNVRSRAGARYVQGELDGAISQIQRAFRSLTFNPFRDQLESQNSGPGNRDGVASTRTLNQIANFESALLRLQASQASVPSLSIFT